MSVQVSWWPVGVDPTDHEPYRTGSGATLGAALEDAGLDPTLFSSRAVGSKLLLVDDRTTYPCGFVEHEEKARSGR